MREIDVTATGVSYKNVDSIERQRSLVHCIFTHMYILRLRSPRSVLCTYLISCCPSFQNQLELKLTIRTHLKRLINVPLIISRCVARYSAS